jgi:DNA-binding transcriptional LysR family regulator
MLFYKHKKRYGSIKMKIEQLRQIIAIADAGSISRAASSMYLSHSTLSSSVRSAESELGGKIFVRKNNGVALTDFGNTVYEQARSICSEMDYLVNMNGRADGKRYFLNIAHMYSPIAKDAFTDIFNKYSDKPLQFSMLEGSAFEIFDMVRSGKAEVGIFATMSNAANLYRNAVESNNLVYEKITDRKLYVMLGRKNPLYYKKSSDIYLDELSDYTFAYYTSVIQEAPILTLFSGLGNIRRQVSLPSLEALVGFLHDTDAFTVEPVNPEISLPGEQGLRFFNLGDQDLYTELGWVRNAGHELSPLAAEFIDRLYERVERLLNLII